MTIHSVHELVVMYDKINDKKACNKSTLLHVTQCSFPHTVTYTNTTHTCNITDMIWLHNAQTHADKIKCRVHQLN